MPEENLNQELLDWKKKKINERRIYWINEINQNELMSKKHKYVLNYIDHVLIVTSTITGCVSISPFTSLMRIPINCKLYWVGRKKHA